MGFSFLCTRCQTSETNSKRVSVTCLLEANINYYLNWDYTLFCQSFNCWLIQMFLFANFLSKKQFFASLLCALSDQSDQWLPWDTCLKFFRTKGIVSAQNSPLRDSAIRTWLGRSAEPFVLFIQYSVVTGCVAFVVCKRKLTDFWLSIKWTVSISNQYVFQWLAFSCLPGFLGLLFCGVAYQRTKVCVRI